MKTNSLEDILKNIKSFDAVNPDPTFKATAKRIILHGIYRSTPVKTTYTYYSWRFAFATLVLFFLLSSAVVVAAQSSTPSDPLYPIKIASEKIAISAAQPFPSLQNKIIFEVANRRIEELESIQKQDKTEDIKQAVESYSQNLQELKNHQSIQNSDLNEILPKHNKVLQKVLDKAPVEAKPEIEKALDLTNIKTDTQEANKQEEGVEKEVQEKLEDSNNKIDQLKNDSMPLP